MTEVTAQPVERRRRRVSSATSERDRTDAWWIAGFAAVAGGFAGTAPAGFRPADVLITAAFAGIVILAASRARLACFQPTESRRQL